MKNEFMPHELHAATVGLVTEATDRLQDVLQYSHAPTEWEWPRMVLYRLTDAQDTLGVLVGLHAAYARREGCEPDVLNRYLQTSQQRSRTEMPQQQDLDYLDGLTGQPDEDRNSGRYIHGKVQRDHLGDNNPHQEWTLACLHALHAFGCDDPDALQDLPAHIKAKAQRVLTVLVQQGSELEPAPST
ncbi:hypothetical protein [Actinomadura sp. 9N407]|uniref:hypothetical protein n=1 Tax=Actinomadura sp. 9N407 TaxID=3375154 RepID=UPI00378ECF99